MTNEVPLFSSASVRDEEVLRVVLMTLEDLIRGTVDVESDEVWENGRTQHSSG